MLFADALICSTMSLQRGRGQDATDWIGEECASDPKPRARIVLEIFMVNQEWADNDL